jgi:hypothetical protein
MIHPKLFDSLLHPFCMNRRSFAHDICTEFNGDLSFGSVDQAGFIPLATVTGFPGGCTQIAEARTAPAGNVEATLIQLYDVLTIGTGLPLQRSSKRSDL